jgi:transcriptional regulator with XRE-family HTH domain
MTNQQKKLELTKRIREFRKRADLSQVELGDRLGVSGNYISMIEVGKKDPGPSLRKLFEAIEHSPLYSGGASDVPGNPLFTMLSMETLITTFAEVADKLTSGDMSERKQKLGNLREMLDEIDRRLLASSGELSEAQRIAVSAAKPGTRGTK